MPAKHPLTVANNEYHQCQIASRIATKKNPKQMGPVSAHWQTGALAISHDASDVFRNFVDWAHGHADLSIQPAQMFRPLVISA